MSMFLSIAIAPEKYLDIIISQYFDTKLKCETVKTNIQAYFNFNPLT